MSYKLNGVELPPPSTGKWINRDALGIDGSGNPIYPAKREFEMQWVLISPEEVYDIQQAYFGAAYSGTVVVDLPKFRGATWEFYSYSGCVLREPTNDEYFNKNESNVILLVTNIRTE